MKRIVLPCCQSWCKMTCNEVQYGWLFLQYLWLTFTRPRFFLQTCFFALNWWMFSFMGLCFIKLSIFNLNIIRIKKWLIYELFIVQNSTEKVLFSCLRDCSLCMVFPGLPKFYLLFLIIIMFIWNKAVAFCDGRDLVLDLLFFFLYYVLINSYKVEILGVSEKYLVYHPEIFGANLLILH